MAYYLTYDNKTIGPIAPDNPKHPFDHPTVANAVHMFAKQMNDAYDDVTYKVIEKEVNND